VVLRSIRWIHWLANFICVFGAGVFGENYVWRWCLLFMRSMQVDWALCACCSSPQRSGLKNGLAGDLDLLYRPLPNFYFLEVVSSHLISSRQPATFVRSMCFDLRRLSLRAPPGSRRYDQHRSGWGVMD